MMFVKIRTIFFLVLLSILLQSSDRLPVEAVGYEHTAAVGLGGLGGLGGIAGGLGALGFGNLLSLFLPAHLGVLGPMKLALMSKLGLALGIVGTALGGSALGIALKNDEHRNNDHSNNDYYDYNGHSSYSSYDNNHNHFGGYGNTGYRKKRDIENVLEAEKEEDFDFVYKSDKNKCTEKLICDIAHKYVYSRTSLQMDEFSILLMVKSNPRQSNVQSKAHRLFEKAMRMGLNGSACKVIYASCKYDQDNLMNMIRLFSSPFNGLPAEKVISYIRS